MWGESRFKSRVQAALRASGDLVAVGVVSILINVVTVVPVLNQPLLRGVLGLGFVLLAPGYVLVSALYPEVGTGLRRPGGDGAGWQDRFAPTSGTGVDSVERLALAFALSLALSPLLFIATTMAGVGLMDLSTRVPLTIVTLGCAVVAVVRRMRVPVDQRFFISIARLGKLGTTFLAKPCSRTDAILNGVLALAIVFAVGALAFGVTMPPDGEQYTGFYVLTENETGEPVAGDYPSEFTAGESRPIVFGINNQEHEPMTYTVVVELQRAAPDVFERERLTRFRANVGDSETWQNTYQLRPTMTGETLRVTALLYKGEPPANPSAGNAYRELHFWVSVSD